MLVWFKNSHLHMEVKEASWILWLKLKIRLNLTHHLIQSEVFLITSNPQLPKNKEHTMKFMELKRLNVKVKLPTEEPKLKMLLAHSKLPMEFSRLPTFYWRKLKQLLVKPKISWTLFPYILDSLTMLERKTLNHTTEVPLHSMMLLTPLMIHLIWLLP